jgi:hypothetical protein
MDRRVAGVKAARDFAALVSRKTPRTALRELNPKNLSDRDDGGDGKKTAADVNDISVHPVTPDKVFARRVSRLLKESSMSPKTTRSRKRSSGFGLVRRHMESPEAARGGGINLEDVSSAMEYSSGQSSMLEENKKRKIAKKKASTKRLQKMREPQEEVSNSGENESAGAREEEVMSPEMNPEMEQTKRGLIGRKRPRKRRSSSGTGLEGRSIELTEAASGEGVHLEDMSSAMEFSSGQLSMLQENKRKTRPKRRLKDVDISRAATSLDDEGSLGRTERTGYNEDNGMSPEMNPEMEQTKRGLLSRKRTKARRSSRTGLEGSLMESSVATSRGGMNLEDVSSAMEYSSGRLSMLEENEKRKIKNKKASTKRLEQRRELQEEVNNSRENKPEPVPVREKDGMSPEMDPEMEKTKHGLIGRKRHITRGLGGRSMASSEAAGGEQTNLEDMTFLPNVESTRVNGFSEAASPFMSKEASMIQPQEDDVGSEQQAVVEDGEDESEEDEEVVIPTPRRTRRSASASLALQTPVTSQQSFRNVSTVHVEGQRRRTSSQQVEHLTEASLANQTTPRSIIKRRSGALQSLFEQESLSASATASQQQLDDVDVTTAEDERPRMNESVEVMLQRFLNSDRKDVEHMIDELLADGVDGRVEARDDAAVFKKPIGRAPKMKQPVAKKVRRSTIYSRKEVMADFQSQSDPDIPPGPKLNKDAQSALMDVSQRFMQKVLKRLSRRLEGQNRTTLCLNDIKELMGEFGWLPEEDPNDVKFNLMLMQYLNPEEQRLLVPMSKLDGKPGSTTLPADIWTKVPKERRRKRSSRRSREEQEEEVEEDE